MTSGLGGSLAIPHNPWIGSDPELVAQVRARVVGPVRMPDGPPLSATEARRFQHANSDGVLAYVAAYERGTQRVLVHALQSAHLIGSWPDEPRPRVSADGTRVVRIQDAGVWVLISGSSGPCFESVTRHVRRWSAARHLK